MSTDRNQKKLIMQMIERILLNEEELTALKMLINDVSTGKIDSKQLKLVIIKSRVNALKKIIEIFPFFHKRINSQQEIDTFTTEGSNDPQLLQELEEKNTFLQEIGTKINNIVNQLKD